MSKNSFGVGVIVGVITFCILFSGFPLSGSPMDFVGSVGVGLGYGVSASVVTEMSNKRQRTKGRRRQL